MDAQEERRLRKALVGESERADRETERSKRFRQSMEDALVYLAPLRRLLVTLEAEPNEKDFEEARELVRRSTKLLDDALDGKDTRADQRGSSPVGDGGTSSNGASR
jgi:hypothetical protein